MPRIPATSGSLDRGSGFWPMPLPCSSHRHRPLRTPVPGAGTYLWSRPQTPMFLRTHDGTRDVTHPRRPARQAAGPARRTSFACG